MQYFDQAKFAEKLMSQCAGKSECAPEFDMHDVTDGRIFEASGQVLFAQVSCKQTNETLFTKNLVGVTTACLGLMIVAYFQTSVGYL